MKWVVTLEYTKYQEGVVTLEYNKSQEGVKVRKGSRRSMTREGHMKLSKITITSASELVIIEKKSQKGIKINEGRQQWNENH